MSDTAIVTIVTGIVTVVTLWIRLKYGVDRVADKVDVNTDITQKVGAAAVANARAAVETAADAKEAAQSIDKKLNGGIDAALSQAVGRMQASLDKHALQDEKNLAEINARFTGLSEYVHQRNHDMLNEMNKQSLMIEKYFKTVEITRPQ